MKIFNCKSSGFRIFVYKIKKKFYVNLIYGMKFLFIIRLLDKNWSLYVIILVQSEKYSYSVWIRF